jgi:PAS domain S-box-containing protein
MAELVQAFDWSTTPLGPRETWSDSLNLAFDTVQAAAFPMALRWGPQFVLVYNDGYRPILGDKHPWALGRPASEAWAEVWPQIEPAHTAILSGATPAIYADDMLLRIQRHGTDWDDARFTLGYSPVPDPTSPTGVGGILVTALEITDRLAAEAALRASEERYELALAASGAIGTWDWDIAADRVIANAKFAQLYSVDAAVAAAGAPIALFFEGIHPDDRDRVRAEIQAGVRSRQDFASEYRLLQKDGSIAWVYARGRCHYDADGKPARMPGAAVDITDRKNAEQALAENRSYLSDLLKSSGEAFYALDREGNTTLCNQAFLRLTGFEREEDAIGRKLHDVIHHTHPDGETYHKTDCPIYKCASFGTPAHVDNEFFFRLNGERFPVEYWVHPVYRDGELHGAICTFIDITERKAAEAALARSAAEFKTLAEAVPNLLWAAEPDGELTWFNEQSYAYSGPLPRTGGPRWLSIVHPDEAEEAEARWEKAVATGEVYETQFRLRRADGAYRWHLARALPIRDEDGQIIRWIGSNTDIEDQKAAAAALANLNTTLEHQVLERTGELMAAEEALRQSQKMEAVGQLTGGIAHDFNNMLTVVIGSLELLGRRLAGGDARALRYVEAANEGARRASLLTQRLLAFSRQQPLQPEPIDVNKLVSGMSDLLRHSIGADVRLEAVLAGGLWQTHADPNQLENVILNLGVNARDAMPGGGRLTIETQNAHLDDRYVATHIGVASGQYVMIAVTDTGDGMPADVIEKAFDPFFTTKAVGKGTGLGLSQVYGFVKQSGGHVKIYSEPGQGTTVKIYLPRLVGGGGGHDEAGGEDELIRSDYRQVVLVVEDEPAVRAYTVDALSELGYQVLEAEGAAAALRLLDTHPEIVLLFTDVVMPDVNGAKLAEMARQRRPDLKVLFTTGYTRNAVVHNGVLDLGVELIGKPFTLEALSAKLLQVLGEPQD